MGVGSKYYVEETTTLSADESDYSTNRSNLFFSFPFQCIRYDVLSKAMDSVACLPTAENLDDATVLSSESNHRRTTPISNGSSSRLSANRLMYFSTAGNSPRVPSSSSSASSTSSSSSSSASVSTTHDLSLVSASTSSLCATASTASSECASAHASKEFISSPPPRPRRASGVMTPSSSNPQHRRTRGDETDPQSYLQLQQELQSLEKPKRTPSMDQDHLTFTKVPRATDKKSAPCTSSASLSSTNKGVGRVVSKPSSCSYSDPSLSSSTKKKQKPALRTSRYASSPQSSVIVEKQVLLRSGGNIIVSSSSSTDRHVPSSSSIASIDRHASLSSRLSATGKKQVLLRSGGNITVSSSSSWAKQQQHLTGSVDSSTLKKDSSVLNHELTPRSIDNTAMLSPSLIKKQQYSPSESSNGPDLTASTWGTWEEHSFVNALWPKKQRKATESTHVNERGRFGLNSPVQLTHQSSPLMDDAVHEGQVLLSTTMQPFPWNSVPFSSLWQSSQLQLRQRTESTTTPLLNFLEPYEAVREETTLSFSSFHSNQRLLGSQDEAILLSDEDNNEMEQFELTAPTQMPNNPLPRLEEVPSKEDDSDILSVKTSLDPALPVESMWTRTNQLLQQQIEAIKTDKSIKEKAKAAEKTKQSPTLTVQEVRKPGRLDSFLRKKRNEVVDYLHVATKKNLAKHPVVVEKQHLAQRIESTRLRYMECPDAVSHDAPPTRKRFLIVKPSKNNKNKSDVSCSSSRSSRKRFQRIPLQTSKNRTDVSCCSSSYRKRFQRIPVPSFQAFRKRKA